MSNNNNTSKDEDVDVEEGKDTIVESMTGGGASSSNNAAGTATNGTSGGGGKTSADHVVTSPPQPSEKRRVRQTSSTDIVTKMAYVPTLQFQDLALAEAVMKKGNQKERQLSGLSQEDFMKEVEDSTAKKQDDYLDGFMLNHKGLTSAEAEALLEIHGRNELPEFVEPKWKIFLRQFYAPMPIMIWVAITIELGIQNWIDTGILLVIQFTNAIISFYEINKAGNAVKALKNSLKPTATVKRDGKWMNIDAVLLVPTDTVLLASGSSVPADCRVNHGEIEVDQSAMTGESLPVTFYQNDSCKMGSTVVRGEVEGTIEFTGAHTFFGKTAALLKNDPNEVSHIQKILIQIMYILVGLSVTFCSICFIYLMLSDVSFEHSLSFTIVLLVASIPLAIEIVTTTTLAIGSKTLAKHGAIVTKLASIEELAGMSILCSDKTGTLTLNQMVLQDETPTYTPGQTQKSVLVKAALAAKWNEPPRDALDRLTLNSVDRDELLFYEQLEYIPFDPTTKRTEGTLKDTRTGLTFKTSKGAPHIIMNLIPSNDPAREKVENDVARFGASGIRSLAVAYTEPGGSETLWKMAGLLTFLDPPRPDTKQTLFDARKNGVLVKMITGDHLLIARSTSKELELGELIFGSENLPLLNEETKEKPTDLAAQYGDLCLVADGFAQVFPEHKYLIVECLRELGYTVGMTGDGVNDAPALKRADVGIAVAGSTDAAMAAADIVFTEQGLSAIIHGIITAREVFARMNNFITYRISATLQLLFFFFIALFAFKPDQMKYKPDVYDQDLEHWPEFFQMPVLMLMLITVLNDGTLITIAYDYAKPSQTPCKWNIPVLFIVSGVLGMVSCLSSLLLLHFLLDSWNPNGFLQKSFGMEGVQYGQIISAIYLKVSVSDFLTLFSSRTGRYFFFQVKPGPLLLIGGVTALAISSILSIYWPTSKPDGVATEGLKNDMDLFVFVWIFCIIWWIIQDICKVITYQILYKTNFNQISSTGVVKLSEKTQKFKDEMMQKLLNGDSTGGGNKHH